MTRNSYALGVLLFCAAFVSCSGGNSIPSKPWAGEPSYAAGHSTRSTGQLVLTLPAIQPSGVPIVWSPAPNRLSTATRFVRGTIGKQKLPRIPLTAANGDCVNEPAGLTCTVVIDAPAGSGRQLTLATYAKGIASPLATSSSKVNIFPGQSNYATVTFKPIAHALGISVEGQLQRGQTATVPIVVYAIDAANQPIPSSNVTRPHGAVIAYTVAFKGFYNTTWTSSPPSLDFVCCGPAPEMFLYDGIGSGKEKITVAASGYANASTRLKVGGGNRALATLMAITSSQSPSLFDVPILAQFASTADGNVAPLRTFFLQGGSPIFGEDTQGNFWYGNTKFSNDFTALGSVTLPNHETASYRDYAGHLYAFPGRCDTAFTLDEYPANAFGSLTPIREIVYPTLGAGGECPRVTADSQGNIYVSIGGDTATSPGAQILVFAPNSGSGNVKPSRTLSLPFSAFDSVSSLDTDVAGNLYAGLDTGFITIYKFAPNSNTATAVNVGSSSLEGFAVDDNGDIFGYFDTGPPNAAIEEYPSGSSIPSRTISGPATLVSPYGSVGFVIVPRS